LEIPPQKNGFAQNVVAPLIMPTRTLRTWSWTNTNARFPPKSSIAAAGTETTRLIKKLFNMTLKSERGGCRFVVAQTDEGKPVIKLELFHDTVPTLTSSIIGFEVLSGVTVEQARSLVNVMNEKIVGVVITQK